MARLIDEIVRIAQPLRIVLFGSFARHGADAAHDTDLLVVVTEGTNRRATTGRLYGEIRGVRTPFDIVVATPSDREGRRGEDGLVYADIARDGGEVYAARPGPAGRAPASSRAQRPGRRPYTSPAPRCAARDAVLPPPADR
ncbi:MAG: nucleotidyltransferase domain-containing protein [Actinomycetes bacterium]